MPFTIIRNDITNMRTDAIVNTANPRPVVGSGTDTAIHTKAGPGLLAERLAIGNIAPGDARLTPGYNLDAKYVIHTVGPIWQGGGAGEAVILRRCYENSLRLAAENGCESVAFPLISTGNYGFPKELALQIAIGVFSEFLMHSEMQIYLVVFSREAYQLSEKLFAGVSRFIDEHYVRQATIAEYGVAEPERRFRRRQADHTWDMPDLAQEQETFSAQRMSRPILKPTAPTAAPLSLAELLKQTDEGFSENLLRRIDLSGKKDAEIYKRANITRQHFSKIRNNPDYRPTKATALAFAVALELSLDETRDLIGRAGYTLSHSSKFDIIIEYFIRNGNYNIHEINMTLFEFDQSLLGA